MLRTVGMPDPRPGWRCTARIVGGMKQRVMIAMALL
jgi:ABC-type glutathione transport system ATPase component